MFPRGGVIRAALFWPFQVTPASLAAAAPLPVSHQPLLLGGCLAHRAQALPQEGHSPPRKDTGPRGRAQAPQEGCGRTAEPLGLEGPPLATTGSQRGQLSVAQHQGVALAIWYPAVAGRGGTRPESLLETRAGEMKSHLSRLRVDALCAGPRLKPPACAILESQHAPWCGSPRVA